MGPLPVIPTPHAQKLREFRVQFLPAIVFACTLGAIFGLWRAHFSPPPLVSEGDPGAREIRALADTQGGALTNMPLARAKGALVQAIRR